MSCFGAFSLQRFDSVLNKHTLSIRPIIVSLLFLLLALSAPINLPQHTPSFSVSESTQTAYQMIQYHLPNGSTQPFAIATDGLGREWIAEQGSNQLGMFDPSNSSFKEYAIPTADSTPNAVAVDQAGNVWVTELTGNNLAELKAGSNRVIEYSIPNGSVTLVDRVEPLKCGPIGVFVGPHQNIWIFCDFSNQIDEFFAQNSSFDRFNLPVWQSGPVDLVFDHQGNFWFTAADANMLGKATVSELRNGTTNGITEFAPRNSTYTFIFAHPTSLAGETNNITSSLPTPAGIGISPDGKTLWITEHVDGSFDSYNIATRSLDRFWTSKTYGAFGYPYSFPNGLAVDASGMVWMAEHYGNKVAEYDPYTGALTEYGVPCCGSISSGLYTLTLGANGTIWFVEIFGNSIGQLKPVPSTQSFEISTQRSLSVGNARPTTISIPVKIQYVDFPAGQETNVSLDIAGISKTGALTGASAQFDPVQFPISQSGNMTSELNLTIDSLKSGIYDFTLSANISDSNTTYSTILAVSVGQPPSYAQLIPYAAAIAIVVAVAVIGTMRSMMRRKNKARTRKSSRHRVNHQ